ncbi:hypothetical protein RYX36_013667 [Vicia faba]
MATSLRCDLRRRTVRRVVTVRLVTPQLKTDSGDESIRRWWRCVWRFRGSPSGAVSVPEEDVNGDVGRDIVSWLRRWLLQVCS